MGCHNEAEEEEDGRGSVTRWALDADETKEGAEEGEQDWVVEGGEGGGVGERVWCYVTCPLPLTER